MSDARSASHRAWQLRNPERVREYNRQWRARNPDKTRAYNREWMRNYRARQRDLAGLPPLPPVTVSEGRRTDRDLERMEGMVSRLPTVTLSPFQRQRLEQVCQRIRSILQEGER